MTSEVILCKYSRWRSKAESRLSETPRKRRGTSKKTPPGHGLEEETKRSMHALLWAQWQAARRGKGRARRTGIGDLLRIHEKMFNIHSAPLEWFQPHCTSKGYVVEPSRSHASSWIEQLTRMLGKSSRIDFRSNPVQVQSLEIQSRKPTQ